MSVAQKERAVQQNVEIFFPEGIIGFPEQRYYRFVQEKSFSPFIWIEAANNPQLSFILIDPKEFKADYLPKLNEEDKNVLQCRQEQDLLFFSIVCVPQDSDRISANLLAPVAINKIKGIGRQVVLQDNNLPVRHFILEETFNGLGEEDASSFPKT